MRHELKTWPEAFEAMWLGRKRFELREDDRGFSEGDELLLREWNPATERYSGRCLLWDVTYLLRAGTFPGLVPGHVIMSVSRCQRYAAGVLPIPEPGEE